MGSVSWSHTTASRPKYDAGAKPSAVSPAHTRGTKSAMKIATHN